MKRGSVMEEKNKVKIICAIITLISTVAVAFIGAKWGESQPIIIVNSIGESVELTDNDVQSIVSECEKLKVENSDYMSENRNLKNENLNYKSKIEDLSSKNDDLESKLKGTNEELSKVPSIEFRDMGLSINGEEQVINKTNSCVVIDGIQYFTRDFIDSVIEKQEEITLKDGMMYIGKIISEKAFLSDQWVIDKSNVEIDQNILDSFGNNYTNAFVFLNYENSINIKLAQKYSMLKAKVAIREGSYSDVKGYLEILADGVSVYKSSPLTLMTEVFEIDIPINNANVLTISYSADSNRVDCIIADAIVYN